MPRIVGQTYMGLQGIFGIPLDVAATYIVLFTIYGAVLEYSGAGRFFLDISLAAFGQRRTGPGRTTTLAGFLLGTVSGSGVATTVTLGSRHVADPARAGYPKDEGGGVLAAAGIGAILSPPTLGAAAFIIAEFLKVSYLKVLLYAAIPTLLYYLGILLAIEVDARRFETDEVEPRDPACGRLLLRYGYHFSSLIAIVVLLAVGFSPFRAVLYATVLAFLLSFLDPTHRMAPARVFEALAAGARGGAAGRGDLRRGGDHRRGRDAHRPRPEAVGDHHRRRGRQPDPVRAAGRDRGAAARARGAGDRLVHHRRGDRRAGADQLGVEPFAAYMFIFYYAVLSEVSPPTALSAFAAAAITGGNALPHDDADLEVHAAGLPGPVRVRAGRQRRGTAAAGRRSGRCCSRSPSPRWRWPRSRWRPAPGCSGPARLPERVLCGVAALVLLYLEPLWIAIGLALLAARRRRPPGGRRQVPSGLRSAEG